MHSKSLAALVAPLVAVALAGCGSGPAKPAAAGKRAGRQIPPAQFVPLDAAKINAKLATIKSADVEGRQPRSSGLRPRFPARAALLFWRDIQFQNYPRAYGSLTREFRAQLPYKRFLTYMGRARGFFVTDPHIADVLFTREVATVYLAVAQPGAGRSADTLAAFNLRRIGDRWMIAPDPFNMFRTPPGSVFEASRPTPTATATPTPAQ